MYSSVDPFLAFDRAMAGAAQELIATVAFRTDTSHNGIGTMSFHIVLNIGRDLNVEARTNELRARVCQAIDLWRPIIQDVTTICHELKCDVTLRVQLAS